MLAHGVLGKAEGLVTWLHREIVVVNCCDCLALDRTLKYRHE